MDTDQTIAEISNFIQKWSPPSKRPEMIRDLHRLVQVSVREATDEIINKPLSKEEVASALAASLQTDDPVR